MERRSLPARALPMLFSPSFLPRQQINHIQRFAQTYLSLPDLELKDKALELRHRARAGIALHRLMPEAYALVSEAAFRCLGLRHFDVQFLGGIYAARGRVIEMETGQGKSLTAILPLFLFALQGKGAHLATSNDYLAERDATTMRPVFELLGLSCGHVADQMPDELRRENYACDITYGTSTEFGFDFLRDRTKRRAQLADAGGGAEVIVQRGLHFLLADEADSLLIDDANTPMVLGTQGTFATGLEDLMQWVVIFAPHAQEHKHFTIRRDSRKPELTSLGRRWARECCRASGLDVGISVFELYDYLEKAITVHRDFHRDEQYLVREKEVVLIQESTGRLGEGRQLQGGLHQIIQAYEGLPITPPNSHAARITVQGFVLTYDHLSGMSGTALSAAAEFRKVYKLRIQRIPTAVPSKRIEFPLQFFLSDEERWRAICEEIATMQQQGRATLIGTRSVDKSEHLSRLLQTSHIPHCVVNARQNGDEALAISKAGQAGAVTVATGMAGRGTDIKLAPEVREAGGLHVIMSELHDSSRADQQLIGRCARQGDPGSYRQFLSATDEILDSAYGSEHARILRATFPQAAIPRALYTAQRRLERRQRDARAAQLMFEKQKLKSFREMGLDPVLDVLW